MYGVSQCIISWILLLVGTGNIMAFNLFWLPCSGAVCQCPPQSGDGRCCFGSCFGVCNIPRHDLQLSWTNVLFGDGSVTLHYNSQLGSWYSNCGDIAPCLQAGFGCQGGAVVLGVESCDLPHCNDINFICATDDPIPNNLGKYTLDCGGGIFKSLTAWTYDPDTGQDFCPDLSFNGFASFTVASKGGGPPPSFDVTCFCIQVYGCNNLPYPDATVTVNGDSEQTDIHGKACFVLDGDLSGQTLTVTVSEPTGRFKTYTGTIFVHTRCGFIDPGYVQLEADDGYHCTFCYLLPLNKILQLSVNCLYQWNGCPQGKSFNAELTWSDHCGQWVGQASDAFDCPCFPGGPFPDSCPWVGPPFCQPVFSTLGCPGETCFPNTITASPPPAFMIEFTCNDQVNDAGVHSCANGTCSDCGVVPCTTDECGFTDNPLTGYICCSSTLTE